MKRLISVLIFVLLLPGVGWGAGVRLYPVDYLPMGLIGKDITYLYGKCKPGSDARIAYTSDRTVTPTQGYDFTAGGITLLTVAWSPAAHGGPDVLFVVGHDASMNFFVFKSVDHGQNFGDNAPTYDNGNYVLKLGDLGGGNQITGVETLLDRGFCYDSVNKQVLLGEYNAHAIGDRTAGSTNDQVRLMKTAATDLTCGDSWSEVAHWNTDGSNRNILHIHGVSQDPYSGYIYITTGDTSETNIGGIFRWDGVSALASNVTIDNYAVYLTGATHYVASDILYTPNYLFYSSDDVGATIGGIWRVDRNLSGDTRVDSQVTAFSEISMLYGLKTSSGTLMFTDYGETGATEASRYIYTSTDNGATWAISGRYNLGSSIGGSVDSWLEFNGEIYYTYKNVGRTDSWSTAVFKENGPFTGDEPEIIHPVNWIATTGTDTTSTNDSFTAAWGHRPSTPWATPRYALIADKMTNGARLIIGDGTYSATASTVMDWDAFSTNPGNVNLKTVIESQSADKTKVIITQGSGGSGAYTWYIEKEETPLLIKNITVRQEKSGSSIIQTNVHDTRKGWIYFEDCTIDDGGNDINQNGILNREAMSFKRCLLSLTRTANAGVLDQYNAHCSFYLESCIVKGGSRGIMDENYSTNSTSLEVYNTTFYGYGTYGYIISHKPLSWSIKNCIFQGKAGCTAAIIDAVGGAEDNTNLDYNCYADALSGITAQTACNEHSLLATDPKMVAPASGIYKLQFSSPCKDTGVTGLGVTKDFIKNTIPFGSAPDMGAYEYIPGGGGLSPGLGLGGGNAPPWVRRKNQ